MPLQFGAGEGVVVPHAAAARTGYILPPSCTRALSYLGLVLAHEPQTLRAVSTTSSILRHCSSSVSRLPAAVDAKPHCGLRARFSIGTYRAASLILLTSPGPSSSSGRLELIRPRTTVFPLGM